MRKAVFLLWLLIVTATVSQANELYNWGENLNYELGDGTQTDRPAPQQNGSDNDWVQTAHGMHFTLAIKSDGTLWGWGINNGVSFLGDGSFVDQHTPVQIGTDNDWAQISCGYDFTVAIKTNGTLWAWGRNGEGQLGDGTTTERNTPVQIGTATSWKKVICGYHHTLAIRKNGTLWAWGSNSNGRLGDGSTVNRKAPKRIGSDADWKDISAGVYHSMALKTNGTLWAWGGNSNGQHGDGTTNDKTSPTQTGTSTDWSQITCGWHHTFSIKNDGTLWAWGRNRYANLGDGTVTTRTSPVQIGSNSDWSKIASGFAHALATRTDGTLWTWGWNRDGQLGDGTTTNVSTPAQLGSETKWADVACGYSCSFALYDNVAPTISVSVSPSVLSTVDNKMKTITATVTTDDNNEGTTYVLTSITSNETITNDVSGAGYGTSDLSFKLRAKRDNAGSGRVYTITYTATDTFGNTSTDDATVTVPYNSQKRSVFDNDEVEEIISIYPNPSANYIIVNGSLTEISNIEISLFNSLGQRVSCMYLNGANQINEKINIETLPSGIYLVEIKNGSEIYVKNIVKN